RRLFARLRGPRSAPPVSAGVKAGAADDNLQFNAFLDFIAKSRQGLPHDVSHRVIVSVRDREGLPLADARVTASDGGRVLAERRTCADRPRAPLPLEDRGAQGPGREAPRRVR